MNIYLTKDNEEMLRKLQDWTMSGLVNYLLKEYWSSHNPKEVIDAVEKPMVKTHKRLAKQYEGIKITTGEVNKRMNSLLTPDSSIDYVKESAGTLCKHGSDPNFCKFRKNGKPCK